MNKLYTLAAALMLGFSATAQTIEVTFSIDMTPFISAGNTIDPTNKVRVTGNWTSQTWEPANDEYIMSQVGTTNVYSGTFTVDPATVPAGDGGMQFKFLSANAWGDCDVNQECLAGSCTNGSNDNRFIPIASLVGNLAYTTAWDSCENVVITSTNEALAAIRNFNVYPNPANDVTNVAFNVSSPSTAVIEVYNALGQRVMFNDMGSILPGAYNQTLDMSGLNSGMYFVKLNVDGRSRTTRVNIVK